MALNTTAILTRIREVLDDGLGTTRTIATGRFESGLYDGQDPASSSLRALATPLVEPRITRIEPHSASPFTQSALALMGVDIEVDVVRKGTLKHKLNASERDALRGLAVDDASLVQQALGWGGNLTTTSAGTATNIISGLLIYDGSSTTTNLTETSATVTSTHAFHGIVKVTQPT